MARPHEKLANALQALQSLQGEGFRVFQTNQLARLTRERLIRAGYLRPIVKGWYMLARPDEPAGDSTTWFASLSAFVRRYADARFGADWYVSPELSIQLHAGTTVMPNQIVIHAKAGGNSVLQLPERQTFFDYAAKDFAPKQAIEEAAGLRVLSLPWALARVSETFFRSFPRDAQIALARLSDASTLSAVLLEAGQSVVAGRLTGALRAIGRAPTADEIRHAMRSAGYTVLESNPFEQPMAKLAVARGESSYSLRLRVMWEQMREPVLAVFDTEPGRPRDAKRYLEEVNKRYVADAYHSLSIEGYRVTEGLIERVRSGVWNPAAYEADAQARDALAARGYWQAHAAVKRSISEILAGAKPGAVARADHGVWYRELFAPGVAAGMLNASELAGYRGGQVFIRNSRHVPPSKEAVRDCMPALFDLLEEEPAAAVRAVLGHFMLGYVHPYMDGNGRIARFLMNAMLASGGFPWTVVPIDLRAQYMTALEKGSVEADIRPLARMIARLVRESAGRKRSPRRTKP